MDIGLSANHFFVRVKKIMLISFNDLFRMVNDLDQGLLEGRKTRRNTQKCYLCREILISI